MPEPCGLSQRFWHPAVSRQPVDRSPNRRRDGDASSGCACERFGPFAFGIARVCEGGNLNFVMRNWSVFGVSMPRALSPRRIVYDMSSDGGFEFYVEISLRLLGLLVRYQGWRAPLAAPHMRGGHGAAETVAPAAN